MSPRDLSRSPLAAFLRAQSAGILDAWDRAERRRAQGDRAAGSTALREELPSVLSRIADRLDAAVAAAASHGEGERDSWNGFESVAAELPEPLLDQRVLDRLRDGFDLEEVASQYAVLRRCVLRHLEQTGIQPSWLELTVLHEALDQVIILPAARSAAARERALGALDRVSAESVGSGQIDRLLRRLLEVLLESVRSIDWAVMLLLEGEVLRIRAAIGVDEALWGQRTYKLAEGFIGRVVRERRPVALRSAAPDPLATDAGGGAAGPESGAQSERPSDALHALYGVPLLAEGRLLGVEVVSSRRVAEFSDGDRALFRKAAERAAALTTKAQLREQLAAERSRLEVAIQRLPVGVAVAEGTAGVVVLSNRRFTEIVRGPEETPTSAPRRTLLSDADDDQRARWLLSRALHRGETVVGEELEFVRGDGERRRGSFSATPVRDAEGRVTAAVLVVEDVTERRRAERAREFLVESSVLLAESLDYDGTIEQVARLGGERFADLCTLDLLDEGGVRRPAASARLPEARALLPRLLAHPPELSGDGPLAEAMARGEPTLVPLVTDLWLQRIARGPDHLRALRELGPRSVILAPLAVRGRKLGLLSLWTVERELQRDDVAVAAEFGRLASLVIDSARLYREAQQAVRAREEFVSIAAHELRAPLTALDVQVQALRRGLARDRLEPKRLSRGLDLSARQCQRLARLIDNLLDLSRVSAGKLVLEREPVDLTELAVELVHRYEERFAEAGCEATLSTNGPVTGVWDQLRIEQVLTNLLTNAIKYAPGAPIEVAVDTDGAWARLSVRDHGPGISPADRARIFAPFQRASGNHAPQSLGLGLYISRQIIESHGGTVEVSAAEGQGTTFVVRLPREAPPGALA